MPTSLEERTFDAFVRDAEVSTGDRALVDVRRLRWVDLRLRFELVPLFSRWLSCWRFSRAGRGGLLGRCV